MATSSECDLTALKGVHITPKRAFKNLMRDVAERLEDKEAKDICWQMELPKLLEEKPALEVLRWLIDHGKCSETNAQPLVELFKDIRREDLAGRVEDFQKEFGHNYSMPETSHQTEYASHTSDAENLKAAHTDNTLFGSVSNCPASVQDDLPSGISKAQQESSIAVHEESCSEIALSGSACSIASFGNAFLPSFTPPSGLYRRKVSDASIPFTLESSSASSSLLEIPPPLGQHPPSGMMWYFSSNSSSGVSQENMQLHSSNSDIMDPNVMALTQYQPRSRIQRHGLRGMPHYNQSSVASLSTPMSATHGSSNSMNILHPKHTQSTMSHRLPMCRSMSQDYHKPLRKSHYSALHRRHTFTPADRQEKGTQHGAIQVPKDCSRVSEVSKEVPQNQICQAGLPTCRSCCKPHTHYGQTDYPIHPISPSATHLRCPHYECCSEKVLQRGWYSGEENDHELHHSISGPYNGVGQFDDAQTSDAESELSMPSFGMNEDCNHNENHLEQQSVSCLKKRNSVPVFRSQCLDNTVCKDPTKSEQNHRQSLDVSTLKRSSACTSTLSGNASTSNRSLISVNTLIGSASNSKSPVSSPPTIRSRGDAGSGVANISAHSVASVSQVAGSKWRPVSGLFHTKPKPRLIESNKLVWPVKRDKLNKYIYKHKTKLLRCKLNLELTSEAEREIGGASPKLSLQLHPYGAEEDGNKFITAKVSIESRRCRLHSDTRIAFTISAREGDPTSGAQIGQFQEKQEQITKSFFYIKQFIDHQVLKNSSCDYVQVITSAMLIMPNHNLLL